MPYLSICAVFRDEGPYLREWVEFHRLVGVERFYLYNNKSIDDYQEQLAPYVEEGLVVLHEWPDWPAQMQCYEDCLKRYREESRWIAFLDLDEFLFSPTGRPVPEVLTEFEQWPGVGVNTAVFGSNGHETRPPGLVMESYTARTDDPNVNRQIKSIVNPMQVRNFCTPHFFVYREGLAVDENKGEIGYPRLSETDEVSFSLLRINHYTVKSHEDFMRKLDRGPALGAHRSKRERLSDEQVQRWLWKWNDVEDRVIQRYLSQVKHALVERERLPAG